jgi:hypothetical protein
MGAVDLDHVKPRPVGPHCRIRKGLQQPVNARLRKRRGGLGVGVVRPLAELVRNEGMGPPQLGLC